MSSYFSRLFAIWMLIHPGNEIIHKVMNFLKLNFLQSMKIKVPQTCHLKIWFHQIMIIFKQSIAMVKKKIPSPKKYSDIFCTLLYEDWSVIFHLLSDATIKSPKAFQMSSSPLVLPKLTLIGRPGASLPGTRSPKELLEEGLLSKKAIVVISLDVIVLFPKMGYYF